jgi:hypothetical protein
MLPEFKERVEEAAKESGRSMNAEIVERLARTFQTDDAVKLMHGNVVLLRALADFVVLRHAHPEAMAPMEEAMLKMARAIKETDDTEIFQAAKPSFHEYVSELTASVNRVTDLLGPGWAKDMAKPKPTAKDVDADPVKPRPARKSTS